MLLGDLGADVIKIEKPEVGEDGRPPGRLFRRCQRLLSSANRNKRSLTLDIKRPEGQETFRRLAETADVVIENFRPGVMDALGIGYASMSERNPRIIYCSISGFGMDGPFADRPGLDQIIQGFSGLMSVTGFEGGDPVRVGIPIADLLTGLYGAYGILAAPCPRADGMRSDGEYLAARSDGRDNGVSGGSLSQWWRSATSCREPSSDQCAVWGIQG